MLATFPIREIQRLLAAVGRSVDSHFTSMSIDNARMAAQENARRRELIEALRGPAEAPSSSVRSA